MEIKSKEISIVDVSKIVPNPKNPNKHPKEQLERLSSIIEFQGFRQPLIISKRSGFLVAGHGRLEYAKLKGITQLPVMYQDFESEAQEYAFCVSDNEIARWAQTDLAMVNQDMLDLGPDFDVDMLGIKDFVIDLNEFKIDNEESAKKEELDKYSKKVSSPVYTPKKDVPPPVSDLFTLEKYEELVKEIKSKNLPKDIEFFLINSASRHIVFNYENIAEFYCHQHSDIQDLMEKSALVIIDFNKAIEGGFVKLTEEIKNIYDQSITQSEVE
jgi:hypothetical protein